VYSRDTGRGNSREGGGGGMREAGVGESCKGGEGPSGVRSRGEGEATPPPGEGAVRARAWGEMCVRFVRTGRGRDARAVGSGGGGAGTLPHAHASSTTMPKGSLRDGTHTQSDAAKSRLSGSPETDPRKRTESCAQW
jgi:hypothetical protein